MLKPFGGSLTESNNSFGVKSTMSPNKAAKLFKDFPVLFRDRDKTLMSYGFCCGDGWYSLLYWLCEKIAEISVDLPKSELPMILQVREKHGELLVYVSNGNKEIEDVIRKAQKLSHNVCEVCGRPGQLQRNAGGHLKTLCSAHAQLLGYAQETSSRHIPR